MRKFLFFLFIICFCVGPSFAQRGKLIERVVKFATQRGLASRIAQKIRVRTVSSPLAQISNLPGTPLVQVRMPQVGQITSPVILTAQVLSAAEIATYVGGTVGQIYIPQVLTQMRPSWYRGMKLKDIQEVENILVNGLEVAKSSYPGDIYTSSSARIALSYAIPTGLALRWGTPDALIIPAVVSIRPTAEELERCDLHSSTMRYEHVAREDIPADMLQDVVVFLDINGKPDWYQAGLEGGKLVLTPTPTAREKGFLIPH